MRKSILSALFLLLLPTSAMAIPWFDQAWAEELVARSFPEYWAWIERVEAKDHDRYINLLQQGRSMAMNREVHPELVEAWETRFYALMAYQEQVEAWRVSPDQHDDAMRQQLIAAAEDLHLANLELFDAQLATTVARAEVLELRIADHELNFDIFAIETVERAIGPVQAD
jgi:hypothetical protein